MLNFEQAYSSAEHHIYSRPNKVALLSGLFIKYLQASYLIEE